MALTIQPRIPPEITDIIVDFLHDDQQSLTNCSLVCKAWLPVTRYHIFKSLTLDRWNIADFLNLIMHPLANVVPYIQQLVIDQVKSRHHPIFEDAFRRLPQFNLLRRLELRNISWIHYAPDVTASFFSAFKRIRELSVFKNMFFEDGQFYLSMITSFPYLQKLSVAHNDWMYLQLNPRPVPIIGDIFTHLRVLELGCQCNAVFLRWLMNQRVFVNSLSICPNATETTTVLNQYLRLLGPSLFHLTLETSYSFCGRLDRDREKIYELLDLSSNTHLRTLHFGNTGLPTQGMISSAIPTMLFKIPSPHLNEVAFYFDAHSVESGDDTWPSSSTWKTLDQILSQRRSLSAIYFTVRGVINNPSLSFEFIKNKLSSCYDRGILHVNFQHPLTYLMSRPSFVFPLFELESRRGNLTGPYCIAKLQDTL